MQRPRQSCWIALRTFGLIFLVGCLAFVVNNYIRMQRMGVGFIPFSAKSDDYPSLASFDVPRISHPDLPRSLNDSEYQQTQALMAELDKIFVQNNITYILAYGSLLGSYIFHDIIPWDDDIDILVRFSEKKKLVDPFSESRYDHIGAIENEFHPAKMIKLFYKTSQPAGKRPWKWPFVDACFYTEDIENVPSTQQQGGVNMKKTEFYPFHKRPYGRLWLPAPYDTMTFLRLKYGTFVCKSHSYDHKHKTRTDPRMANCSSLLNYYPMVYRTPDGEGVRETLKLGQRVLYSVHIEAPYGNQSKPYTFWVCSAVKNNNKTFLAYLLQTFSYIFNFFRDAFPYCAYVAWHWLILVCCNLYGSSLFHIVLGAV